MERMTVRRARRIEGWRIRVRSPVGQGRNPHSASVSGGGGGHARARRSEAPMNVSRWLVLAGQSSRVTLLLVAGLGAGIALATYFRRRNAIRGGNGGLDPDADSPTLTWMGIFVAALASPRSYGTRSIKASSRRT